MEPLFRNVKSVTITTNAQNPLKINLNYNKDRNQTKVSKTSSNKLVQLFTIRYKLFAAQNNYYY
jgi:hypothetical protein